MIDTTVALNQLPLLRLTNGFMSFKTFAAAVELDVFTRLSEHGPITAEEFARLCELEHRPADLFLAALTSLELLKKEEGRYGNSALAEEFLVAGRPYYFGGYVRFYDRKLYPGWQHVVRALTENRPTVWDPAAQESIFGPEDSVVVELFWEAMHSLAGFTGRQLSSAYNFGAHQRLLDVGGGSGGIPIELCGLYSQLTATVYEYPHVCAIAEAKIAAAGLADVITTTAGDFVKEDALPGGHDLHLLCQILHCLDEATNRDLLAKCFDALPGGGTVMIVEHLLNAERSGPPEAALMGMNMLVAQTGGKNYSETEYTDWLTDAGFVDIKIIRFQSGAANGAVIARKPLD